MSEVLSDKKEHKYVTTGFFLPISELWAVVELQRKIIYIHLSLYLNKTTRVDVVGYKGSSLNTKDAWKTLFSVWESNSTHLNVNASFFPDTKPRTAAVCKFLQNVNWQTAALFFLGHQPFFLGSCYKISSSPWNTLATYYSMSWKGREHKLKANRDSLQSVP